MEWAAEKKAVAWPVLSGAQLDDISAYLGSLARSRPRKAQ
jgi:hypothetical protein